MRSDEFTYKTAESVTEGHPDKVCDIIADTILDRILMRDKDAHVAVEVMATHRAIIVAGEITSTINEDEEMRCLIASSVQSTLFDIGYDPGEFPITILTHNQSRDIFQAVNKKNQGAGDQGIMYGYACRETEELMPQPIILAHKLAKQLTDKRKDGTLPWARPDGKTQVTVMYKNGIPEAVTSVIVSTMHDESAALVQIREAIIKHVITPIVPKIWTVPQILVNPSGRFVEGGPSADTGLTGRKLMVDTYGGIAKHGGGALSGKDPSKVDRSGAYMARKMARDILKASPQAMEVEVSLAYAIGQAEPTMLNIKTIPEDAKVNIPILYKAKKITPEFIIDKLRLKQPIYKQTASYGHFGKSGLPWEM